LACKIRRVGNERRIRHIFFNLGSRQFTVYYCNGFHTKFVYELGYDMKWKYMKKTFQDFRKYYEPDDDMKPKYCEKHGCQEPHCLNVVKSGKMKGFLKNYRKKKTHWGSKLRSSIKTDAIYDYCDEHNCKIQGCKNNFCCPLHICFHCENARQPRKNLCKECEDKMLFGGIIIVILVKKGLSKDLARYIYDYYISDDYNFGL
jgi:hypothetical protein